MNFKEKRDKAIRTGCYSPSETKKILLKISTKEVNKIIKDNNLTLTPDHIIEHLKSMVYLNNIVNTRKTLSNEIIRYDNEIKEQFPKLFWEEYVFRYDPTDSFRDKDTYLSIIKKANNLWHIWEFLESNPEFHGYTGQEYQSKIGLSEDIYDISGMTFSWRAWGQLMAAYMNSKKGKRLYHYMDFYMG